MEKVVAFTNNLGIEMLKVFLGINFQTALGLGRRVQKYIDGHISYDKMASYIIALSDAKVIPLAAHEFLDAIEEAKKCGGDFGRASLWGWLQKKCLPM